MASTAMASTAINPHALLRLCHLVSPALPVGAYAYSQGLEYAVQAGWVVDEASTLEWLQGLSRHGLGTLDLPILLRLHAAWSANDAAALQDWNAQLIASRGSAELRAICGPGAKTRCWPRSSWCRSVNPPDSACCTG
jgi:urease accessory protein